MPQLSTRLSNLPENVIGDDFQEMNQPHYDRIMNAPSEDERTPVVLKHPCPAGGARKDVKSSAREPRRSVGHQSTMTSFFSINRFSSLRNISTFWGLVALIIGLLILTLLLFLSYSGSSDVMGSSPSDPIDGFVELTSASLNAYLPLDPIRQPPQIPPVEDSLANRPPGPTWWFLELYAPWCRWCRKSTSTMMELATLVKSSPRQVVFLGKIDATKYKDAARRFRIDGYPTFLLVNPWAKDDVHEYHGNLESQTIYKWIFSKART